MKKEDIKKLMKPIELSNKLANRIEQIECKLAFKPHYAFIEYENEVRSINKAIKKIKIIIQNV